MNAKKLINMPIFKYFETFPQVTGSWFFNIIIAQYKNKIIGIIITIK